MKLLFFSIFYCGCKLPKSIHLFSPAKIVQGERKCKFTCNFPSRSLISSLPAKIKLVQGERKCKFTCNFPSHRLYSLYNAFTGFSLAAFHERANTIALVTMSTMMRARAKTHQ